MLKRPTTQALPPPHLRTSAAGCTEDDALTAPPLALLVRKLGAHVALDDADREALLALPHTMRRLRASAYLVREGEQPGPCVVLIEGFALRQKLTQDGGRQIVAIQMPGDPVDLHHLFLDWADHNVQALTDVAVAMIPRPDLRALAQARPAIDHAIAVYNEVEASIAREWLLNVGRRDARARLAHLLCEVAVRLEGQELVADYGYELPMSQEQIGDTLGLTSVHVNRTLRALEADGLIARSKRTVLFPEWEKLRRVAGFNPLYLHLGQQRSADAA